MGNERWDELLYMTMSQRASERRSGVVIPGFSRLLACPHGAYTSDRLMVYAFTFAFAFNIWYCHPCISLTKTIRTEAREMETGADEDWNVVFCHDSFAFFLSRSNTVLRIVAFSNVGIHRRIPYLTARAMHHRTRNT